MPRLVLLLPFLLLVSTLNAAEKAAPEGADLFGKVRIRLLDKSGAELKFVVGAATAKPAMTEEKYQCKDAEVVLLSCVDPASRSIVCRVESPLLESGDVLIGLQFPKENRLPKLTASGNRATFEGRAGKILLGWNDKGTLTSPKPRKELKVILAEYGGTDRWADVTETVRDLIIGDTLDIRAGNFLFGDPAGGVVKNLMLTYSLEDDEKLETFSENQLVKIQFDPKDQFYRLDAGKQPAFEFVVAQSPVQLPVKLPTFAEAKKHAESMNVPKSAF